MSETKRKNIDLSLVSELCFIINHDAPTSPDTVLARYFLDHFKNMSDLNVYDVADECLVSRSSIHRFCHRIGYQNFKEMKADFQTETKHYDYFMSLAGRSDFIDYMKLELIKMIVDLNEQITQNTLDEIATRIHDAKEVVMISSYSGSMYLFKFQRPLILSGKIIRIMTDQLSEEQYSFLRKLDKESFVIVFSAMGNYAATNIKIMEQLEVYKALVTASYREDIKVPYDKVYYLSKDDYTNVKSVYTEYGLSFFFDILYSTYLRKYGIK